MLQLVLPHLYSRPRKHGNQDIRPTREPIGRVGVREAEERVLIKPKRVVDADDVLTPAEAKRVRHGMKQIKAGKTRPWAQIKDELGL